MTLQYIHATSFSRVTTPQPEAATADGFDITYAGTQQVDLPSPNPVSGNDFPPDIALPQYRKVWAYNTGQSDVVIYLEFNNQPIGQQNGFLLSIGQSIFLEFDATEEYIVNCTVSNTNPGLTVSGDVHVVINFAS